MDGCSAIMLCFSVVVVITAGLVLVGAKFLNFCKKHPKFPPAVPGFPLIGNLHQLKEKKPHLTFAKWSEKYGPIYTIRTGASTVVVLNSTEIAKEAMVTRFPSISTRKLPKALALLTANKAMVAMSDYNQFHKMAKRCILTSVLGPSAQKRHRSHRNTLVENVLNGLHSMIKKNPLQPVNLRELFRMELFSLSLKQALGKDVESAYVEEFGREVSKKEMFSILVTDPMEGAIEVDWRDFFPYLRWFPNKTTENKIQQMVTGKVALTRALIQEQRKRIASGEAIDCYLDFLLSEDQVFTEEQLTSLVWEAIIEASDTTLVTTEWAMFELARNQKFQDRLHLEIREVCGSEKITEEHFSKLPYLSAAFHETLRRHSPVPIIPLRYAHVDTQLGGYHIPAGSEIAINLYACNSDKKMWDKPEEWNPERFLEGRHDSTDLYKTMAFGSGKRACAGALQAMLISCAAIGRCIQEFQWELKEGEEEKTDTVQLTTHKLHPMQAYLKPRGISFANQKN